MVSEINRCPENIFFSPCFSGLFTPVISKLIQKISPINIFNEKFLKDKDNALKPIEFLFDSIDENEDETLPSQKKINEKSMNKISKSFSFNSNIIIIESSSENSYESDFNHLIEKEIEKINSLNKE